jgi:hypothetical protein
MRLWAQSINTTFVSIINKPLGYIDDPVGSMNGQ